MVNYKRTLFHQNKLRNWLRSHQPFAVITLPFYLGNTILLQFQVSDVGGAKFDSKYVHLPVIKYISEYGRLPSPENYSPWGLPLFHFIASIPYRFVWGIFLLHFIQTIIAISTLAILYKMACTYIKPVNASLLAASLSANSYFVASNFYATTDGFAIFAVVLFLREIQNLRLSGYGKLNFYLLNLSLILATLNRQVLVYLFLIYLIAASKKVSQLRKFLYISPAFFVTLLSFYLFYFEYCNLLGNNPCKSSWNFSQLPVFSNLPASAFFYVVFTGILFWCYKNIFLTRLFATLVCTFTVMFFFLTFGEQLIINERVQTGGMFFHLHDFLGIWAPALDIFAVTLFLLANFIFVPRIIGESWLLYAASIVCIFSLLGPVAFQRYFEPYLLVLLLLASASFFGSSEKVSTRHFRVWLFFILIFQSLETSASCFFSNQSGGTF